MPLLINICKYLQYILLSFSISCYLSLSSSHIAHVTISWLRLEPHLACRLMLGIALVSEPLGSKIRSRSLCSLPQHQAIPIPNSKLNLTQTLSRSLDTHTHVQQWLIKYNKSCPSYLLGEFKAWWQVTGQLKWMRPKNSEVPTKFSVQSNYMCRSILRPLFERLCKMTNWYESHYQITR